MLNEFKLEGPWRITFDTNPDQCNLNCIMCEEHSKYNNSKDTTNRIMKFELIKKVIKNCISHGLKEVIPSTMGEPLLYKNFRELLKLIKMYALKLNLTTNGTFPILGAEKWGRLILPIASDVKISINGVTDKINESIMEGVESKKQIANLENFLEIRNQVRAQGINYPTVTIQATFMERNIMDLPDLLKFAIDMDVDRFKGHHLWVTHNQLAGEDLRRNKASIKRWNKTVEELEYIAENNRLKNRKKIRLDNIYKLPFNGKAKSILEDYICLFLGREAWIAWDGTFNVCCAPNDLRASFGYFGNINNYDFMDLWKSRAYLNLINNWGSYNVCKSCNMRRKITKI
ncbi:MAG: radical SAM/SPASM domain-containing protein [Promethearchaeota archaeon]